MRPAEISVLVGLALGGAGLGYLVTVNNLSPGAAPEVVAESDPACEQDVVNLGQHAREAQKHLQGVEARRAELERR